MSAVPADTGIDDSVAAMLARVVDELGGVDILVNAAATRNTGASEADVQEVLLHVAIYAGVPRANHAFRIAKETFAAMAREAEETKPE